MTTSSVAAGPKGGRRRVLRHPRGGRPHRRRGLPGRHREEGPGLGATVRVVLGTGAPDVVEVPNRLGSQPLPTPSIKATPSPTESIPVRKATGDICS